MIPRNPLLLAGALIAGLSGPVFGTLIVSESFDYYPLTAPVDTDKFLRGDNNHNGGLGWADEWKAVSGDPQATGGLRLDTSETSVAYPGASSLVSVGGQINDPFGGASERLMSTPINMGATGDLYFSALVNRSAGASCSVEFVRSSDGLIRWRPFVIDASGNAQTGIETLSAAAVSVVESVDHLIVGKLERGEGSIDVASLTVFPLNNPGAFLTEPASWDVVHDIQGSGIALDTLRVSVSTASASIIDELRLGDSYADVVGELGLIYEPFDYGPAVNLTTETSNNGTGWTDAWASTGVSVPGLVTSGTGQSLYFDQSPSLISDGSTHVFSDTNKGNERDFTTAVDLASQTLYFTALVRDFDGGATVARMRAEFYDGAGASGNMRANVGIDAGTLFADGITGGYTPTGSATSSSAFATDTTYLLAMKRTGSSIFASLIAADGNSATLAAEPGTWQVQDDLASGVDLTSIRLLMNTTDTESGGGLRIDELRIATDWDSAVGGIVIPEPSSVLLGLFGTLALMRRRRVR